MSVAVLLTDCTYLVAVLWAACAAYNGWMLQPVARVAGVHAVALAFYWAFNGTEYIILLFH